MLGCRPLTDEELRLVLDCFEHSTSERDRALFTLGTCTGFRISELLSLRVCDVLRNGILPTSIRVPRAKMKGKKRARSVFLSPLARAVLSSWLAGLRYRNDYRPALPLFPSMRPPHNAISRVQAYRVLRDAFRQAVLHLDCEGTHTMRKTFARAMWLCLGENIFKVQQALGHAHPGSTVAYLSFNDQEQVEAVTDAFPVELGGIHYG